MIPATGGALTLNASPELIALVITLLFGASFFFSGTETAMFSLQKHDRQTLTATGTTGALLGRLLARRSVLITTILIGNELANVALAATTASLLVTFAPGKPWLNVLVLTPMLVLISEITPKVIAYRLNRTWARFAAWPLTIWAILVTPVRMIFSAVVNVLARLFRADGLAVDAPLEEDELRILVDRGAESGAVAQKERDLIEAVFELDDLTVDRLMTPRPDMFAVSLDTPWGALLETCKHATYSRIPVFHKKPDEIVGVLLLKDLLRHRNTPPLSPRQFRAMLLPPVFVLTSKPADAMLRNFLERKYHMAFVVDEHGTLVGVVTLDDLLDALIGDSLTEDTQGDISRIDPSKMRVNAAIDLEDFVEETAIPVPEGEYHTLGGFVFHRLGRLPRQGDAIEHEGWRFLVSAMEGRRIAEIEIIQSASQETA